MDTIDDYIPAFIKEERAKLDVKQKEISKRIEALQKLCPHTTATVKHTGSTGGYDKDVYWAEHTCPACGKFWTTQS